MRTGIRSEATDATGTSGQPRHRYLAHVRQYEDGSCAIHDLEEHLRAVGDLAEKFASSFGQAG